MGKFLVCCRALILREKIMIKFINLKDSKGSPIYGQPLLDSIFCANVAANTLAQVSVPQGADACMISATGNYIVSPTSSFTLPTDGVFQQTSGDLNKSTIHLGNLFNQSPFIVPDTLYFLCPDQTLIYVSFFSIT